jgi:hypothetical protein
MLFLSGQISGAVAENASDSRGFCDCDAARQCRTARACDQLLIIIMPADLSPSRGCVAGKLRSQMNAEQANTVDALKKACPGYVVMRSLVMSFRTILRTGKIKTLRAWMKKADASGIYRMQRFVRTLKQDQSAVEAAVEQSWSNGPVEGHINRLKTLKRQMYGRAGFELLLARVLPLPPPPSLHQS